MLLDSFASDTKSLVFKLYHYFWKSLKTVLFGRCFSYVFTDVSKEKSLEWWNGGSTCNQTWIWLRTLLVDVTEYELPYDSPIVRAKEATRSHSCRLLGLLSLKITLNSVNQQLIVSWEINICLIQTTIKGQFFDEILLDIDYSIN